MLYKIYNGSVTLGGNTILEDINFEVKNNERVAVIGRNGCGKTTLLRAIVGDVSIDKGLLEEEVVVTSLGISNIGYVKQELSSDDEVIMLDYILGAYDEILKVESKLKKLEGKLENSYSDKLLNQYQDLCFYYHNIGGYDYKKEYEQAILKFGFKDGDKLKKIKEFSYGQRTKIAFLKLVLSKPDLLLLDEPTNHLDINAIEWLEKYLSNYPKMLVLVSHDRMFMDLVCNVTYEIEYGSLERYAGNYSFYEKQKKINYEKNLRDFSRQQKEIERLQKIADRFRYKPSKASMAISKLKQIERMVKLDKPNSYDTRTFSGYFNPIVESYRDVLKVKGLEIGYDKVLSKVDFSLERGERLGIIGENGTGKSTFLKTLMGEIPKLSGKFVFGNRVEIGYFDQNVESLNGNDTVLDVMINEFPNINIVDIRNSLAVFEFYGDMVFQKVSSLSGGQKVKLLLCKIMKNRPNVLILDEVTNHLDIISRNAIEELLLQYKGTVIFISHDRYFVKKLATSLLVFEKGEATYYKGDYDYYLSRRELILGSVDDETTKNSNREKKEYVSDFKVRSKLERKIKKLEEEIDKLEQEINNYHRELAKEEVYTNVEKAKSVEDKLKKVENILEFKMSEWESFVSEFEN